MNVIHIRNCINKKPDVVMGFLEKDPKLKGFHPGNTATVVLLVTPDDASQYARQAFVGRALRELGLRVLFSDRALLTELVNNAFKVTIDGTLSAFLARNGVKINANEDWSICSQRIERSGDLPMRGKRGA